MNKDYSATGLSMKHRVGHVVLHIMFCFHAV